METQPELEFLFVDESLIEPVLSLRKEEEHAAFVAAFETIPDWGYMKEVKDHLAADDHDIATCLGPVIPCLRRAAVFEFLFAIVFFVLAYFDRVYGINPIWKWVTALPLLIYRRSCEVFGVRHLIPPYVDDATRAKDTIFPLLGMKVGFHFWFALTSVFSVLQLLDLLTDTVFAAASIQSAYAHHAVIESRWETLWEALTFNLCPFTPGLITLVAIAWSVLLLQYLEPLLYTCPKTSGVKYEIGNSGLQQCMFLRLNFEGIFFFLAEATSLDPIQSLAVAQGMHELSRVPGEEVPLYAISIANQMWKRALYSFFFENCIQLTVQALFFSIKFSIEPDTMQYQAAFSLCLSIFMTFVKVKMLIDFRKYRLEVDNKTSSDDDIKKYFLDHPTTDANFVLDIKNNMMWKRFAAIGVVGILMGVSLINCFVMVIMSFQCDSHIWCLTGCVSIRA